MADDLNYVPNLTFDAPAATAAATAAAAFDPDAEAKKQEERDAVAVKPDISQLTPEEQKAVEDFAAQIDITNTNAVLTYGAASQKNVADFSDKALNGVRTKDLGEVGDMLSSLVVELRGLNFDESEKKEIGKRYNILAAIRSLASKNPDEAGYEREVSDEIAKRTGRTATGMFIPDCIFMRSAMDKTAAAGLVATDTLFGEMIEERTGIKPAFRDERYTTVIASRMLHDNNIKAKKQKKIIDQVAAEIILREYLEQKR